MIQNATEFVATSISKYLEPIIEFELKNMFLIKSEKFLVKMV